jgi:hypothetical protein
MSKVELKACPFCGSGVNEGKDTIRECWYIECTRCGGCYESRTSAHRCAIGWNNRQLAEYENDDTEGEPIGWNIVAIGNDGSALCEKNGKRKRWLFVPTQVAATSTERNEDK